MYKRKFISVKYTRRYSYANSGRFLAPLGTATCIFTNPTITLNLPRMRGNVEIESTSVEVSGKIFF